MELCRTEEEETLRSFPVVLSSDGERNHNSLKKKKMEVFHTYIYTYIR